MSSEEMREELESFVNKGIKEGWEGWPLKDWSLTCDELRLTCCTKAPDVGILSRFQRRVLRPEGRLNRYFQSDFQDMDWLS